MKKVLSFIEENHMIERGEHVLAAVSGGADSVCLLLVLLELGRTMPMKLSVVHVEHGIRGEASRADAEFVKELCKTHGIPCHIYSCDAAAYARERGMSLEEGARTLRYEFFEACRREQKADKIAVAHNQNDCAETVLFHMARGTGIRGLCGILPVRGAVIRPLLCVGRGEIEAFLAQREQAYCTDDTNQELVYSRNKLRHQVLPVLEEINMRAVEHVYQTALSMAEVWELLEEQVDRAGKCWARVDEGIYFLDEKVSQEIPLVQRTLIMELLESCAGSRKDLDSGHVQQVLELFGHQVGHMVCLPYGMRAVRTYGGIEMETSPGPKESGAKGENGKFGYCQPLPAGKRLELPKYGVSASCNVFEKKLDLQEIPKKKYTKWFDYDKIKDGLLLRTPHPEDYLVIDRAGRHQSLKKYFVNEKIPARERERQLVLADGAHVLWVIGYRISEDCKVTEDTTHILEVQIDGGKIHE